MCSVLLMTNTPDTENSTPGRTDNPEGSDMASRREQRFIEQYGYTPDEIRDMALAGEDIGSVFDGDIVDLF